MVLYIKFIHKLIQLNKKKDLSQSVQLGKTLEKKLGLKKILGPRDFGPQKILIPKIDGPNNNFWSKKIWIQKQFWV